MSGSLVVASLRATLGSVRIPMYVAEPADVIKGLTTENARLTAYEVFPEERGGRIAEVPAEGGDGGWLEGPLLPRCSSPFRGSSVDTVIVCDCCTSGDSS